MSPYVSQIFVYGDGLRQFLVAIIVVDPDYFAKIAIQKGILLFIVYRIGK